MYMSYDKIGINKIKGEDFDYEKFHGTKFRNC